MLQHPLGHVQAGGRRSILDTGLVLRANADLELAGLVHSITIPDGSSLSIRSIDKSCRMSHEPTSQKAFRGGPQARPLPAQFAWGTLTAAISCLTGSSSRQSSPICCRCPARAWRGPERRLRRRNQGGRRAVPCGTPGRTGRRGRGHHPPGGRRSCACRHRRRREARAPCRAWGGFRGDGDFVESFRVLIRYDQGTESRARTRRFHPDHGHDGALLQHHRAGVSGRSLPYPAARAARPRRSPPPHCGQALLRAARAASDGEDLRAAGAARPAERGRRIPLRVRQLRGGADGAARRGAAFDGATCEACARC